MSGDKTLAFQYLYSYLCHLEHLAVLSVERGNGVPGQLEDERRHCEIFMHLADKYGGLIGPTRACDNLVMFCTSLRGDQAMIVLNIVAEHWLENVFKHLVKWVDDPHDRELIQSVLDDEHRHVAEAPLPRVRGGNGALIAELEEHLHAVAGDPEFMFPLSYLGGAQGAAALAKSVHQAHERALARLFENSSDFFQALVLCRKEVETHDAEPAQVILDSWRWSAFNLNLRPMQGWVDVKWKWSQVPVDVEARVVRAVARTLREHPILHLTINPSTQRLYEPAYPVVGVRRLGYPGIVTVALPDPSDNLRAVTKGIRQRYKRAIMAPAIIPPLPYDLLRLQPPPRMSAVTTCLLGGDGGITHGLAPLVHGEGAVWSVGVPGEFIRRLGRRPLLRIGVEADHRAVDGRELDSFLHHLRLNLED